VNSTMISKHVRKKSTSPPANLKLSEPLPAPPPLLV